MDAQRRWVDLNRSPRHLGITAICTERTAGVDVDPPLQTAAVKSADGWTAVVDRRSGSGRKLLFKIVEPCDAIGSAAESLPPAELPPRYLLPIDELPEPEGLPSAEAAAGTSLYHYILG